MRTVFIILLIVMMLHPACKKTLEESDGYVKEGQCREQSINGTTVTICFNKLLHDSRCPLDATCIWQGAAKGNFSFSVGSQKASFDLSTWTMKPTYIRDTILFGYKIKLVDVKPYPGQYSFTGRKAKVEISQ